MPKKRTAEKSPDREIVQVQFVGEEAERFRNYMAKQHLRINSEAGRKLMLERIEQVEKAEATA